jgi:signal peptidase II
MRRVAIGLLALGVIAIDRGSKLLVDGMDLAAPEQVLGSIVQIIRGENRGGLFGIVQGSAPILAVLSIGVIVALVLYHEREQTHRITPLTVGVGLLVGGAVGNLIDRLAFGYVLDFIDIGLGDLRFWTFNIADAAISFGILIVLVDTLWQSRSTVRHE